jgi:hypothetical protein
VSEGGKNVNVIIKALDETLPGFKSARHNVSEFAGETKKLLAEAFVGFSVFEFFKTAIEEATKAEDSMVQLSNTLANVGVNYEDQQKRVGAAVAELQKHANVQNDDALKGLNVLIQKSGDYEGSLKNMVLVADVAKSKHLEYADAAELVGRVMGGNTKVLKQFGIVTKDAADGIQQLKERLHGAAEADFKTFGGQVAATKIAFQDMAEAIGDVITGNSNLQGVLASVRDGMKDIAKWADTNKNAIGFWFTVLVAGAKEGVIALVDVGKAGFRFGESLGAIGMMIKARLTGDTDGYNQWKAIARNAAEEVGESLADIVKGHDRLSDAIDQASQKEAEGIKRTGAELAANAAKNQQRLADRAAAAQAARDKEAKAEEDARNKAIDTQLKQFGAASQLRDFRDRSIRETAIAGLNLMESLARRELAGMEHTNATLGRRLVLEARLKGILDEKKKAGLVPDGDTSTIEGKDLSPGDQINRDINAEVGTPGEQIARIRKEFQGFKVDLANVPHQSFLDRLASGLGGADVGVKALRLSINDLGESFANITGGALAGFSQGVGESMAALITHSGNAGDAFKKSVGRALASASTIEGQHWAAKSLAALGEGIFTGDPSKFAAAAEFAAASAAFFAVAGVAGGIGGGGGGVGGGSQSSNAQFQSSLNGVNQGPLTVVWPGTSKSSIDPANPADQDAIIQMIQKLAGNRQVNFTFAG